MCAIWLVATTTCQAGIDVELYNGEPFGVGRVTVRLGPDAPASPWGDDRFAVADTQGRVMYPVLDNRPVRRLLRQFLGIQSPWQATFYFMFRGDEPLELTVYTPDAQRLTVRPETDPKQFDELRKDWWKATARHYSRCLAKPSIRSWSRTFSQPRGPAACTK